MGDVLVWLQRVVPLLVPLIVIVSSPSHSAAIQLEKTTLEVAEELRIQTHEHEHTAFSDISDVAVDSNGTIYVLQRDAAEIVLFDADGGYLRTIGRAGVGPGEFAAPIRLGVFHDSLWVLDPMRNRIIWFSLNAEYRRTVTIRPSWRDSVGTGNVLAGPLADGHFYGVPKVSSAIAASGLVEMVPFLRLDESGDVVDTLVWCSLTSHQLAVVEQQDGGIGYFGQPIRDFTLVRTSPAGDFVIIADRRPPANSRPQTFTVRKLGLHGDTLAEVPIGYTPMSVPAEYWHAFFASRLAGSHSVGAVAADEAAYRDAIWRPEYFPPLEQLIVGIDGSIWLGLTETEFRGSGDRDWIVVSPELDHMYRLRLSVRVKVMQASLHKVWGVLHDSLGSPQIVRYGLRAISDDA